MTKRALQFRNRTTRRRGGMILVVALVVTIAMSSVVLMLCQEMRIESMSAGNRAAAVSSDAIERGAEQYVLALVADTATPVQTLSQDQFAGVQVGDGYFWILYPQY